MGWGKTTHFIATMAEVTKKRIVVTMPNRRLA